jgi:predicted short-subunit dehydrogenase-like oxidoreductase (DUF2520 family)
VTSVRIIGPGRAGRSFAAAFEAVGIEVSGLVGRAQDVRAAAADVDVLLLTVPDRVVAEVAAAVVPVAKTVVAHASGALGLDVLGPHERAASIHPLVTLPDAVVGSKRLAAGAYFVVAGDRTATDLVLALGGHPLVVPDDRRPAYHAAACIASNHLVGLLGQVERIASSFGLPLEAFLPLARGALDDVARFGPEAALTGPAARGDLSTLEAHRRALDESELMAYEAGVELARRLASARKASLRSVPAEAGRTEP